MTKVGVVVPTLYNKEMGYEALESIRGSKDITWTPYIIDNWNENRVLAESWNLGIDRALNDEVDYILIINDDVIFCPTTLLALVERYKNPPKDNIVMVTGHNIRGGLASPKDILKHQHPYGGEDSWNEGPDFSCFMITKDTVEKVGTFDENFIPAYFEDNDYHRRINLLGYSAISTTWAPYYHYGSITQNYHPNMPVVVPPAFDMNRVYYAAKWGGEPTQETFLTPYGRGDLTPRDWEFGYR